MLPGLIRRVLQQRTNDGKEEFENHFSFDNRSEGDKCLVSISYTYGHKKCDPFDDNNREPPLLPITTRFFFIVNSLFFNGGRTALDKRKVKIIIDRTSVALEANKRGSSHASYF